ncbi:MAG: EscU/YscU/HrcU family type III secretion system export apparatus switch protein [Pseudomonadota bacterium]
MAEQDDATKEFEASERKRQQARQDGDIVQSKETTGFVVIIGMVLAAIALDAYVGQEIFNRLASLLYHADSFSLSTFSSSGGDVKKYAAEIFLFGLSLLALISLLVLAFLVATQGIAVSMKKIKPDMKKISPTENLKKKYGARGLLDFFRDALKMLVAGVIAYILLYGFAEKYYSSSAISSEGLGAFTFFQIMQILGIFAVFQALLAAFDFPIQRQLYLNKLRMTREEVKRESKESEGDPMLKQSRREKASKITQNDMLKRVEDATVIVVNPEHYAVALKWVPEDGGAPIVVAKGVDFLAQKIKEVAKTHSVPIYRDPPCARSMYSVLDIDDEIRPEHFAAVAAAIQFIERARPRDQQ